MFPQRPQHIESAVGREADVDHDQVRLSCEHVADGCLRVVRAAAQIGPRALDPEASKRWTMGESSTI